MHTKITTETFVDLPHPTGKGYLYKSEDEPKAKEQVKTKKTKPALKYIKITGYTNRAIRRAYLKSLKKRKV